LIENARLREALERELEGRKATAEQLRIAHDELARINQDLEERVKERTASLTDLLSQMETFSYTVSHDLRAPLRAMAGYARVLQSDYASKLDGEAAHYIERIIRASDRMNRLISDVLAYARVNRDRLEMKPLSLTDSAIQVVQHAAELHAPNVKIAIQPDAPPALGNEAFLTQIFANLLGNAVKFISPDRPAEVSVSFRRDGDYVRTEVRDNGIGIKPEHQSRLFGLFERANNDKRYDGTGIGLAIVKRAIERMGGAVGVVSDGINGSCFWFTLRAATNETAAALRTSDASLKSNAE
jgi:signal transduction histidine kinase